MPAPLVVEIDGESTGSAPLTWGQRNMRRAIGQNPPGHFNLSRVITTPKRAALDPGQAAAVVGALLRRHESLRTVYPESTHQLVRGAARIEVARVAAGGEPDRAAERLRGRLAGPAFDDASELPVRAGVVTDGDRVLRVVLVVSHLAADGTAVDILERELRLLALRGTVGAPAGLQPRELAAREQDSGAGQTEAAVAHWEGLFRRMPPSMFDNAGPPYDPLCQRVRLTSRALLPAVQLVAGRHRVSTAAVLLAATAATVAHRTGNRTVTISTLVNNRFQAGHQSMVTTLAQQGLFGLDITGPTQLSTLIGPAWQAAMRAYRRAYYDPERLWSSLDQVTVDRGRRIDPFCCFNDLRTTPDLGTGADPASLRAAAGAPVDSTMEDLSPLPRMHCRFCLLVGDAPDAITLRLTADTRYLPPADIRRFLYETERLVLDEAGRDPAPVPGEG